MGRHEVYILNFEDGTIRAFYKKISNGKYFVYDDDDNAEERDDEDR